MNLTNGNKGSGNHSVLGKVLKKKSDIDILASCTWIFWKGTTLKLWYCHIDGQNIGKTRNPKVDLNTNFVYGKCSISIGENKNGFNQCWSNW